MSSISSGHGRNGAHPYNGVRLNEAQGRAESLTAISAELGPVVYFIRTDDGLIKIGYTTNLAQRRSKFGRGWQRVLAVIPGTMDDEHTMHEQFAAHLAHSREYFHPHAELIEFINEVRAALGVSAIAA